MNRKEIEAVISNYESFNAYLEEGGEAGMSLGLIVEIWKLDGDEASDRECLHMIDKVVKLFYKKEETI